MRGGGGALVLCGGTYCTMIIGSTTCDHVYEASTGRSFGGLCLSGQGHGSVSALAMKA